MAKFVFAASKIRSRGYIISFNGFLNSFLKFPKYVFMFPFVFSRFYSSWKVCGVENSLDELVFYFQGISPKFGHAAFRDGNDTSLRMASAREVSFFELSKIRFRGL